MKIAIVGTGIAGNVAAWLLRDEHEITVFEAADRIGGHSNTIDVDSPSGPLAVDTGFIVFNDRTYPEFNRLLDIIGQDWQPSVMSFSVQNAADGIEYSGAGLDALFAQRRNLLRPRFWRMLQDILRFNRDAPTLLQTGASGLSLSDYVAAGGYGEDFRRLYLYPMAAAIWSAEPGRVGDMPAYFLVRFFLHHGLLQLQDRPAWRVVRGGSREYVQRLVAGHVDRIRLRCPVHELRRDGEGVLVRAGDGAAEHFDAVFVACHSDQALRMRHAPDALERQVLGAIRYQHNEAVLHTDATLMPTRRRAWAAWNYHVPRDPRDRVAVTYNMNLLQDLRGPEQYLVTLNNAGAIAGDRILRRIDYAHPVFDAGAVAAQARHAELNGSGDIYYCGAYWRNGFHEDGVASAIDSVRHFQEAQRRGKLHLRRAS